MYILLAAATYNEINTTIEWLKINNGMAGDHEVEVLLTGVGGTATAYALTCQIQWRTPELVIQAGIGGSFKEEFPLGSTVFVTEEVFADLGAYDDDEFNDIFDLGLAGIDDKPFKNRWLVNRDIERWQKFALPFAKGATINCISSTDLQVQTIKKKYNPDVESMEGAALHFTCLMEGVPFIQLRSISNFAGERDKSKWKMKEAITILNKRLREMVVLLA